MIYLFLYILAPIVIIGIFLKINQKKELLRKRRIKWKSGYNYIFVGSNAIFSGPELFGITCFLSLIWPITIIIIGVGIIYEEFFEIPDSED